MEYDEMLQELHKIGSKLEKYGEITEDVIFANVKVPRLHFEGKGVYAYIYGNHIEEGLRAIARCMLDRADMLLTQRRIEHEIGSGSREAYEQAKARYGELTAFWSEMLPEQKITIMMRNTESVYIVKVFPHGHTENDFVRLWNGDIDHFRSTLQAMGCEPEIEVVDMEI